MEEGEAAAPGEEQDGWKDQGAAGVEEAWGARASTLPPPLLDEDDELSRAIVTPTLQYISEY